MALTRKITIVAVALLVACAAAAVGCGSGGAGGTDAGGVGRSARLLVTRDFGSRIVVADETTPVTAGLTAMRQLQANAAAGTSYGGKYVTAINGLKQDLRAGRDWLFYVDGREAAKGAAAWRIKPGEVVQWDYHSWQNVKTGGAIVGAFPRPLVTLGVDIRCAPPRGRACVIVRDALVQAGARVNTNVAGRQARVLVGTWGTIAAVGELPDLTKPAATNGAFARFSGLRSLELAGDDGIVHERLGTGAGLIAAFEQNGILTWLVTGVDARGVEDASLALDRDTLSGRFAVAVSGKRVIALPFAVAGDPK